MRNLLAASFAILLSACQTYIPIAVRCEPPVTISTSCAEPDTGFAKTVLESTDQNTREHALTESVADLKNKLDQCASKQAALVELLNSCNKIVDRTVDAVKKIK
ncbi:MAG TPA: hypothetical protein VIF82_11265 [Burkholderiaceae bacterium]|jgi:hypothetical protein